MSNDNDIYAIVTRQAAEIAEKEAEIAEANELLIDAKVEGASLAERVGRLLALTRKYLRERDEKDAVILELQQRLAERLGRKPADLSKGKEELLTCILRDVLDAWRREAMNGDGIAEADAGLYERAQRVVSALAQPAKGEVQDE